MRTPSGPTVAATIRGGTRTPLLATAWYMPAICSTVIDRPCPIGRLPNVEPDHDSRGGTRPALSPGSPTPVLVPEPEPGEHVGEPVLARPRCAVMIVPTLDDLASTPVSV